MFVEPALRALNVFFTCYMFCYMFWHTTRAVISGMDSQLCTRTHYYYLLTYLLPAIEFSLGASSPYTSTDKTSNIHKQNNTKNTIQTIQNTGNTSTHITKTPTHNKTNTHTHTHTLQNKLKQPQHKIQNHMK